MGAMQIGDFPFKKIWEVYNEGDESLIMRLGLRRRNLHLQITPVIRNFTHVITPTLGNTSDYSIVARTCGVVRPVPGSRVGSDRVLKFLFANPCLEPYMFYLNWYNQDLGHQKKIKHIKRFPLLLPIPY